MYGIRNGKHVRSTTIAWKLKPEAFGSAQGKLEAFPSKLKTAWNLQQLEAIGQQRA